MKILHFSHWGLPDKRIERAAYTGVKEGFECAFAGKQSTAKPKVFKETFAVPWKPANKLHLPVFWNRLKKRFKRVLASYSPDLVHAHNVFAAKLCLEVEVPFIFDSHEYWSKENPLRLIKRGWMPLSVKRRVAQWYGLRQWSEWQLEIVKVTPTITVSTTIGDQFTQIGKHVFIIPNFPLSCEVQNLKFERKTKFSSVYLGCDISVETKHRHIQHILPLFRNFEIGNLTIIGDKKFTSTSPKIQSLGFLPHHLMLNELTKHHVGLLPWKPYPYHEYCLPNKAAEYSHAGLPCLCSSSLVCVKDTLQDCCITFNDDSEFLEKMVTLRDGEMNPKEIIEFARENLIWEKHEEKILEAYSLVA